VVGTTTLQPGESTALELPLFMGMHQGMGGPHLFGIDINTNDPETPRKTVFWRFYVDE
jgi:hypothetical protein